MGTGQMMISLGALVLLSIVILRITNGFLMTDYVMLESKVKLQAVSVAASIIEEATGKAFDEFSVDTTVIVTNLNNLTLNLGPEVGEDYKTFNDFDDFNGLSFNTEDTAISRNPFQGMFSDYFDINCVVGYVNSNNPDVYVPNRTWHKKLTVMVTSGVMGNTAYKAFPDTIVMSVIQSNFAF
ncbi:MAG: hypothetical protein L3J41_03530 [Melioribacteraceae bacterium]|nr:hypothetical protein [Melioribacteraceae bacterium]